MTGPNERDEIAWMVHRSCGCGPTVGFDGKPGPICEPDREDWAAADAILGWLAERDRRTAATAVEEVAREWQFGGWTILTAPPPAGSLPSLALGQRVTDWLRARVNRIERGE